MVAEAPTPTRAPNAAPRFISGNVSARPAIANLPTPCPIKILSTILYNDEAVIAIIAGTAYCLSNLEIFSVPNSVGTPATAINFKFVQPTNLIKNFNIKFVSSMT